ncbi:hypothetical protein PSEUBRA_000286 [Kalmanozyma brasiliensis GHG001]|uniref:Uncharacterized protein n=1 Tax=Kalmanozyma brasiliensis (strain GHG001) TaxID=1365824 RepID=V5EWE2_KALBG|nr:uncharacterized protein PSEUBRA_000286 [Kalmanozyma brasiliensis GHG001]EST09890.1 hypothetical protein PSEUBRA_000286 [Kalmanozyma brasiliensis GHG001]
MAATRARTEHAATAPTPPHAAKDVTSSRQAASITDATINDQTPSRRTTTRARKLPSRLLPSPSPPPSRPSSQYNATKHTKGGKDADDGASPSPAVTSSMSSTAAAAARPRRSDANNASSDLDVADKDDSEDLGPGKRKRRPSSMYKPPATLTTVETPSPASALASSKSKKKGRSISPEVSAHKSQSPSASVVQARLKGRLSKGKLEADTPSSKKANGSIMDSDSLHATGDDSDAEYETDPLRISKRVRIGDVQVSMDFSPPPLLPRDGSARIQMPMHYSQPTFIRGGRVSVSPEASAKRPIRYGARDETETDSSRIGQLMRASKRDIPNARKHADVMSSSPVSTGLARFDNDAGAPLSYVPFRYGARTASGSFNLQTCPFAGHAVNEVDENEEEDEDEDDENDFHQAMLDADFDFFESQKSDAVVVEPVWPASRRGTTEEAEMDDTPATTPRSPQSGCDLPSPGSPRCKTEEDVVLPSAEGKPSSFAAGRDSVFAHALPTTQVGADKPHQHAGSLTLSLPYSPAVAASSPQLRAMDMDAASVRKDSKDAPAVTQMGTPILQRRTHAGLPAGLHAFAPLKLGADLMERSASNGAPYMQLSPMIEMDSPLLSPGLSLSLQTKGIDLPSPFIMGVGALPDLEQPAQLDLPPAEGSTTPKAACPEVSVSELDPVQSSTVVPQAEPVQDLKVAVSAKDSAAKADKPSARRPALPPPRQIRFTTFTSSSAESSDAKTHQAEVAKKVIDQHQQLAQHATKTGASTASPKPEQTPDLIHSGSASSESASDAPSPMSQADSTASSADAEVETILFGPPEKLDMHELDHAWGGSKAAQHEAALRRARDTQTRSIDIDTQ